MHVIPVEKAIEHENRSVSVGITLRNLYDMNFALSRFCFGYMICTRLSSS